MFFTFTGDSWNRFAGETYFLLLQSVFFSFFIACVSGPLSGPLCVFCLEPVLILLSRFAGFAASFVVSCPFILFFLFSVLPMPLFFVLEPSILICCYGIGEAPLFFRVLQYFVLFLRTHLCVFCCCVTNWAFVVFIRGGCCFFVCVRFPTCCD